jgi:glucose/arabinose dehydrogenase
VLLQPHSAPLGLALTKATSFRPHGKETRSLPCTARGTASYTGYKIVRLPFRDGKPTGEYQDFVVGFTAGEQDVWGRPVDVAFAQMAHCYPATTCQLQGSLGGAHYYRSCWVEARTPVGCAGIVPVEGDPLGGGP